MSHNLSSKPLPIPFNVHTRDGKMTSYFISLVENVYGHTALAKCFAGLLLSHRFPTFLSATFDGNFGPFLRSFLCPRVEPSPG